MVATKPGAEFGSKCLRWTWARTQLDSLRSAASAATASLLAQAAAKPFLLVSTAELKVTLSTLVPIITTLMRHLCTAWEMVGQGPLFNHYLVALAHRSAKSVSRCGCFLPNDVLQEKKSTGWSGAAVCSQRFWVLWCMVFCNSICRRVMHVHSVLIFLPIWWGID